MLSIFVFGMASGFPWVMIGSVMSAWLKDAGLSRSSIGLFSVVFAVYSINFLWSPLLDRVKLPVLQRLLGQRKSWILVMQTLIIAGCWGLASVNPQHTLLLSGLLALLIALSSATMDIAIDAYRIDSIRQEDSQQQATAAGMATSGWWTGYAGMGAIPFFIADLPGWNWADVYQLLAAMMLVLTCWTFFAPPTATSPNTTLRETENTYLAAVVARGSLAGILLIAVFAIITLCLFASFGPELIAHQNWLIVTLVIMLMVLLFKGLSSLLGQIEPAKYVAKASCWQRVMSWLLVCMAAPLKEFFQRNGTRMALSILLFILLYKLGEAILGRMSIVFYKEIGFSNSDIGTYSKMITWGVTIIASVTCSLVTVRLGLLKGLVLGGISMAASNLLFAIMAQVGPNYQLYLLTIIVDGFTAAWGTVVFVSFISALCHRSFTASQYALMASIGAFGRTTLGAYSGVMVDKLDGNWTLFFIITTLMIIPSMLILYSMRNRLAALLK